MSSLKFPSFNFPYTPSEDLRQFFVDYGRTGPVHVFKNGQNIECLPQKKEIHDDTRVRLFSKKPTLPLNLPGENTGNINNVESQFDERWQEQSVTNLFSDYGAVVFGVLAEEVGTEAAASSWSPPSFNLQHLPKFDPVIERLESDFCDVPSSLLTNLVQESGEEEKITATGKFYSNCLTHARSTNESDIVLVYAGGSAMNELCFSHLEVDHKQEIGSSAKLSSRTGSFSLPERICQVSMGNDPDHVIAVRTHHRCCLFVDEFSHDFEKPRFLGNLQCKTKPCTVTVSPYIPEEVIVAMETGSLWLWSAEDSSVQVIRQCSSSSSLEFDWYFTEFASHPRQVVRGNQSNVELIDLRGKASSSQDLMTLPSPHFFPDDQFTAIQSCHNNPYHYILATTQSLAVVDTRFQQNPVLKWCHSLEHPVKYINVLPDPTTADVLVFVGSYENHDVHCFQYCNGQNWSAPLAILDDSTSVLPPRPTSNPWKISSYNEWPEMMNYANKTVSHPRVKARLNQPLLGLSCVPDSTNKSLTVIQLSNTGDLFYQNLSPRETKLQGVRDEGQVQYYEDLDLDLTASGGCGSKQPKLEKNEHEFIMKWVKCLMEHADNESKDMAKDLNENCKSDDVCIIREELFSYLTEIKVQCSLCSDRGFSDSESSELSQACPYCKMPQELSDKFDEVRKAGSQRQVLTKQCLDLKYEPKVLQMFNDNIQCSKPLGNVLLHNWHSDEQVPIDLTGQQSNNSEDDKQDMVKNWLEQGESSQMRTHDPLQSAREPRNQELSPKTTNSVRSPKTPMATKATGFNIAFGSPSSHKEPEERITMNLGTPNNTQTDKRNQNRTPNLARNVLSSPPTTPGNQTRTPTKKKIARVPGF